MQLAMHAEGTYTTAVDTNGAPATPGPGRTSHEIRGRQYIMEPSDAKSLTQHNRIRTADRNQPRWKIFYQLGRRAFKLAQPQIAGMLASMEYMEYCSRWSKYSQVEWRSAMEVYRGRPNPEERLTTTRRARRWWHYAIACALHEVRLKKPPFNSNVICMRRADRLRYAQLYKSERRSEAALDVPWLTNPNPNPNPQ